jgi:hypothetical protein
MQGKRNNIKGIAKINFILQRIIGVTKSRKVAKIEVVGLYFETHAVKGLCQYCGGY